MVNFYRINSHMKHKSRGFSWVAILLCILSIHVLLSSARPNLEDTSAEKTAESDVDVVNKLTELNPETRKSIQDTITKEKEKPMEGNTDYQELDPPEVEDVEEEEENDPAGDDYPIEDGEVKSFTEPKTSTVPTRPTPRRREYSEDGEEEEETSGEDSGMETETMPTPSTSTSTTEEPTPRMVGPQGAGEGDYETTESSESERFVENTSTIEISTPITNRGLTLKNYSFVLFVSVLLYIFA